MNLASRVKLNQGRFGPQIKCTTSQKTAKGERREAKEKKRDPITKATCCFSLLTDKIAFCLLFALFYFIHSTCTVVNIEYIYTGVDVEQFSHGKDV